MKCLSQHKLCTRKTGVALEILDFADGLHGHGDERRTMYLQCLLHAGLREIFLPLMVVCGFVSAQDCRVALQQAEPEMQEALTFGQELQADDSLDQDEKDTVGKDVGQLEEQRNSLDESTKEELAQCGQGTWRLTKQIRQTDNVIYTSYINFTLKWRVCAGLSIIILYQIEIFCSCLPCGSLCRIYFHLMAFLNCSMEVDDLLELKTIVRSFLTNSTGWTFQALMNSIARMEPMFAGTMQLGDDLASADSVDAYKKKEVKDEREALQKRWDDLLAQLDDEEARCVIVSWNIKNTPSSSMFYLKRVKHNPIPQPCG